LETTDEMREERDMLGVFCTFKPRRMSEWESGRAREMRGEKGGGEGQLARNGESERLDRG
jgi:hypothetical protein